MTKINLNLIRKNPLTVPVLIADKMGLFKKYNLDVNMDISEDFTFDGNKAFYEGNSDAMVGDLTFFFYMLKRGKKAVITSNLTRTINLIGKNLPDDLNGLKVGVNRAGLFRLYLENDLKYLIPNAEPVWINNTYDRMKALDNGEIDALVAIEPFITDIVENGGEIIWSSRDSDKNLVMWAFDEEFYLNNKQAVSNFHKALEEAATKFNQALQSEKIKMCMDCAGYNLEAAKRLQNFEFEKQGKFNINDFNLCQEWMYREKEIDELYNGKELIVDIFD